MIIQQSRSTPFILSSLCLLLFVTIGLSHAQDAEIAKFPTRPITVIVPMPAGGATDMAIRLISKEAERFLGQPLVILNKTGGGGSIGIGAIASAKPDGYTIGYTGHSAMFLIPQFEKVPYDPVKDLRHIMQFGVLNFAIYVRGDSPFATFKDLVTFARNNPKKVTYGTIGPNSLQYWVVEQIAKKEGIHFTHIPFKGAPEIQAALLGGHISFGVSDLNYALIEAGDIKLLLMLREERCVEFPGIPILSDLGYNIPAPTPVHFSAPKGIPDGIAKKLEDAFTKAIKEPGFTKGMKELRVPVLYRNSKDLEAYMNHNYEAFKVLVKESGTK